MLFCVYLGAGRGHADAPLSLEANVWKDNCACHPPRPHFHFACTQNMCKCHTVTLAASAVLALLRVLMRRHVHCFVCSGSCSWASLSSHVPCPTLCLFHSPIPAC